MQARDKDKWPIFEGDIVALPCRVIEIQERLNKTTLLLAPVVHFERAEGQPFLLRIADGQVELLKPTGTPKKNGRQK